MFEISKNVVQLYRDEMELKDGDAIQLYARYAGGSSGGYALGINKGVPQNDDYTKKIDGIIFYVKPDDQWFVEKMSLDYDKNKDKFICDLPAILN